MGGIEVKPQLSTIPATLFSKYFKHSKHILNLCCFVKGIKHVIGSMPFRTIQFSSIL